MHRRRCGRRGAYEILRNGGSDAEAARGPVRHAALRLRPGRGVGAGRGAPRRRCRRRSTSRSPSRPTRSSPSSSTCAAWGWARTSRRAASCGTSCGRASTRPASSSPAPGSATRSCAAAVDAGVRVVTVESRGRAAPAGRDRRGRGPGPAGPAAAVGGGRCGRSSGSGSSATPARASSAWTRPTCARPRRRPSPRRGSSRWACHAFGASNLLDAEVLAGTRGGDRRARGRASPREAGLHAPAGRCRRWARDPVPRRRGAARPGRARRAAHVDRGATRGRRRDRAARGCCSSRGGSSSGPRARTWRVSSTASGSASPRWRSSTAGSTTCSGRSSSASRTGSSAAHRRAVPRRRQRPGDARGAAVHRASTCSPARSRSAGSDAGDLVAVLDVGAYGATESMPLFRQPRDARRGGRRATARRTWPARGSSPRRGSTGTWTCPTPRSRPVVTTGRAADGATRYTPREYDATRPTPRSPSRSSCPSRA